MKRLRNANRRFTLRLEWLVFAICLWVSCPSIGRGVEFLPLGHLPEGTSTYAAAVSYDGSVVVGHSIHDLVFEGFAWKQNEGLTRLSTVGSVPYAIPLDISSDGKWVLARGAEHPSQWFFESWKVYLWNLNSPEAGVPFELQRAFAISPDGTVIAGGDGSYDLWRWTDEGGKENLQTSARWGQGTHGVRDVSSEGARVVGYGQGYDTICCGTEYPLVRDAILWEDDGHFRELGHLQGGGRRSDALAISADGTTVVGVSDSTNGTREAFLWNDDDGMLGLGDLPGGEFGSAAVAVSADGSVVVGNGSTASEATEAFIWDAINGMRSVRDIIFTSGFDATAWSEFEATDISGNGRVVVGNATDSMGFTVPWRLDLGAPIPEPSSLLLTVLPVASLLVRRSSRQVR